MHRSVKRALSAATALTTIGGVSLATAGAAAAHPAKGVVYVAHGGASARHASCAHPDFHSIQNAIESVAWGGVVVVCKGTYPGGVNVDRRVTLLGKHGATIDATGMAYGIGVSASYSVITGLHVKNASDMDNGAPADGILTAAFGPNGPVAADHVTIIGNVVSGNLGSGIDLNSTSHSRASGNIAHDNGVGVNVADDLGRPAAHNVITHNTTNENFGGCGIALADHTGAGVTDNYVAYNTSDDNGLGTASRPDASAGSGVILASPIPGGVVRNNTITHNEFAGNGHGGVVVHAHAPGTDFSGNVVTYNKIGTNNLRTDTSDPKTTGIYFGSASPMSIRVAHNVISKNYYGIFTAGPVTIDFGRNTYTHVTVPVGSVPTY